MGATSGMSLQYRKDRTGKTGIPGTHVHGFSGSDEAVDCWCMYCNRNRIGLGVS